MKPLEPITIVVATDNFYAILLAALLKSIEINHKTEEKIHVYVIDDGISKKNIEMITKTVDAEIFQFFWNKSKNIIPADIKMPQDKSALPITTYLRLFAPYLIPKDTKKMIYLDVDMIVLHDISELWNIDLAGHLFGAVQDICKVIGSTWGGIPNYKELGLNPKDKYFNAGLLLIDPIRWRAEQISVKVINTINDNIESVNFADQYGLNVLLNNQWYEIDPRWNAFADMEYEDPYLVHFLNVKPIFKSYKSQPIYYDLFYTYLRQTPYKDFKTLSNKHLLFRKIRNRVGKILKRLNKTSK